LLFDGLKYDADSGLEKMDNMGYKHKATFEEQTQRDCWIPLLKLQLYTTDTKGKDIISKNSFR
jgi:hypothetical protein